MLTYGLICGPDGNSYHHMWHTQIHSHAWEEVPEGQGQWTWCWNRK